MANDSYVEQPAHDNEAPITTSTTELDSRFPLNSSLWDLTFWKVTGRRGPDLNGSDSSNWDQISTSTLLRILDETDSLLRNLQELVLTLLEPYPLPGDCPEAIRVSSGLYFTYRA